MEPDLYPTMQCAQTSISSVMNELKQSALGFHLFLKALFDLIGLSKVERYYNLFFGLTQKMSQLQESYHRNRFSVISFLYL